MRRFIFILATVLMSLLVIIIALPFIIPVDTYRDQIQQQATSILGRNLTINGELSLSLIPQPHLTVGDVRIANVDGRQAQDMATLEKLEISVPWAGLFSGQIEISELALIRPLINLAIDDQGHPNWPFAERSDQKMGNLTSSSKEPTDPAAFGQNKANNNKTNNNKANNDLSSQPSESLSQPPLTKGKITIEDGAISFLDQRDKTFYEIQDIDIKLTFDGLDQPATLAGGFHWQGARFQLNVQADTPDKLLAGQLSPGKGYLRFKTLPDIVPKELADINTVDINFVRESPDRPLQISSTFNVRDSPVTSQFEITHPDDLINNKIGPIRGHIQAPKLLVPGVRNINLDIAFESLNRPLSLVGRLEWNQEKVQWQLTIAQPSNLIDGKVGRIDAWVRSPKVNTDISLNARLKPVLATSGRLKTDIPSLAALEESLNIGLPKKIGAKTLEKAEIRGVFSYDERLLSFRDADIKLNELKVQGNAAVALNRQPPWVDLDLTFKTLDLRPYMMSGSSDSNSSPDQEKSVAKSSRATSSQPSSERGWSRDPIDISALQSLDGRFKLAGQRLRIPETDIERIRAQIELQKGKLNGKLTSLHAFAGDIKGDIQADARSKTPRFDFSGTLSRIDMRAVAASVGREGISGLASGQVKLSAKGISEYDVIRKLNGHGRLDVRKARFKGIDILGQIQRDLAIIGNQQRQGEDADVFSQIDGSFVIRQGKMETQDLKAISPLLQASAAGLINLPEQTMDMRVNTLAHLPIFRDKVKIPVTVKGSWDDLSIRPEISHLLGKGVQDLIGGILGKQDPNASEQKKETIPALIEGIIGGRDRSSQHDQMSVEPSQQPSPSDILRGILGGN